MRKIPRASELGVTLAVVALTLLISGCGSSSQRARSQARAPATSLFGPFAGYTWDGPVTAVSGVIAAPRIATGSRPGFAGSWIGAEGKINPVTNIAPFVQVGVNEVRPAAAGGKPAQNHYFAFWSDSEVGFHPNVLFQVKPGDKVDVSIAVKAGGWSLRASDPSANGAPSKTIDRRTPAFFEQAVWTQEDVSSQSTGGQLAYPKLGAVHFSGVRVDGKAPRAARLMRTWMSSNQGMIGPTRFTNDRFSTESVHPSAEGLRYQRIVLQDDLGAAVFAAAAAQWSSTTNQAKIDAACNAYADAMSKNISSLKNGTWDRRVEGLIAKLIQATQQTRQAALRLKEVGATTRAMDLKALNRRHAQRQVSLRIKARLGLPVTSQSGSTVATYVSANSR